MNNNRIIVIIVIVALIVFAGAVVVSVNRSSDSQITTLPPSTSTIPTTNNNTSQNSPPGTSSTTSPATSTTPASTKTFSNAKYGVTFAFPTGFKDTTAERSVNNVIASFEKPAKNTTVPNTIFIKDIPMKTGETYEQVLINDVVYDPKGEHPESINEFKTKTISGRTYRYIVVSRFEGTLTINYYLELKGHVVAFSSTSQGVDWTNPNLDIEADPIHVALKHILETFTIKQ